MPQKWPAFITRDLDLDTDAGDAEMQRRWEIYNTEMQALIAAGGVHQDDEGWWVETATGELIGPDPEIERPLSDEEVQQLKPFAEVHPELDQAIKRGRGRPRQANKKQAVTLRIQPDTVARFQAKGKRWRSEMADALDRIETGKAGGLFSDFLQEQETYEATTEQAIKRVIASELASAMHPGELIRKDILPALGVSKTKMAASLGISRQTLYDILNERQPVTAEMAVRFGKLFGNGARFWINLQRTYDLEIAEQTVDVSQIPTLEAVAV